MHLKNYLKRIDVDCPGISESLGRSVTSLCDKHIKTFSYNEHITGLLLGRVQSGKTSQILGTISAAADEGFKIFVLLTTDNVLLQKQTLNRAFRTLDTLNICGETDDDRFFQGGLRQPALIVLKKNVNVLRTWHKYLGQCLNQKHEPIVFVDDEADAASLNTKVNTGDVSSINTILSEIRKLAPSSIYLQVTATPQAPLLQNELSGNKPSFIHILESGKGYLGGTSFYSEDRKLQRLTSSAEKDVLLKGAGIPEGLRKATLGFLIVATINVILGIDEVASFLVHPSLKIVDHEKVSKKISRFLGIIKDEIGTESFELFMRDIYLDYKVSYPDIPKFEELLSKLPDTLSKTVVVTLNSKASKKFDHSKGINIFIGGNSLGRGVTFPKLNTVYYCRTSKTPQADTVWQHSRIFGYDRTKGLCRLHMPISLSNLFRELTEAQEVLFAVLKKKGLDGITLLSPRGTRPTRKAVVDQSSLINLVGGVNYFPTNPHPANTDMLDGMLKEKESETTIDINTAQKLLDLVGVDDFERDFITKQISSLEALKAAGTKNCVLIVRTNRNISANTGTLLSPNDRLRTMELKHDNVLVMYRLNGKTSEGWEGKPLWVPNIKFTEGSCFYSIT